MEDGPHWVWLEGGKVTKVAEAEPLRPGGLEPKGTFLVPSLTGERAWSLVGAVLEGSGMEGTPLAFMSEGEDEGEEEGDS